MSVREASSGSGGVHILWDLSNVAETASQIYDGAVAEAKQRPPSNQYAALDFVDFWLIGELQISRDSIGLFRSQDGFASASDMPVLRVILGLREAVGRAVAEGPQTMFCAGETWVTARADGDGVRLTSFRTLLAPRTEWLEALDLALSQLRLWLNEFARNARSDAILGPWLVGGDPPAFSQPLPAAGFLF